MTEEKESLICTKCVLGKADDPFITFDQQGVCNHCYAFDEVSRKRVIPKEHQKAELQKIVDQIKKDGKGKTYDCIIGVSGGVDSTYIAYLTKDLGLRPLAVHLDNGWNSDISVKNIASCLDKLSIDLLTHVINWEEFRDLQVSYLRASVVDIEQLTDHAIFAVLLKLAGKHGIKHIVNGQNVSTEGILPSYWVHNKNDLINIKGIHSKFGTVPLKTFPTLGLIKRYYYINILGISEHSFLDYIDYEKDKAKKYIADQLGWIDYGGKHFESLFTKFYQAYILPVKFKIDKRKSHLSSLICSGQMTRDEAFEELKKPLYKPDDEEREKAYVLKKLKLSENEFDKLMKEPRKEHTDYPSILNYYNRFRTPYRFIKYNILGAK
ncbi:MAG: N-acetyl sugar amidotransferase [Flavobacteriales bacterium]|nr:N-acetyl sugar amidotransferase [Flavobacteriales bacterium]